LRRVIAPCETIEEYLACWETLDDERKEQIKALTAENQVLRDENVLYNKNYLELEAELKKQCVTCRQNVAQCEDCRTALQAENDKLKTLLYSNDTSEWKSAAFQKIKGLEADLQTLTQERDAEIKRCREAEEEANDAKQALYHGLDSDHEKDKHLSLVQLASKSSNGIFWRNKEISALRLALQKITEVSQFGRDGGPIVMSEHYEAAWLDCVEIARKALTPSGLDTDIHNQAVSDTGSNASGLSQKQTDPTLPVLHPMAKCEHDKGEYWVLDVVNCTYDRKPRVKDSVCPFCQPEKCTHNYGVLGVGCMPWCDKSKVQPEKKEGQ
jgi:hypothetical protein